MLKFIPVRICKVASWRLLSFTKRHLSTTPQQLIDDCLKTRSSVQALSDKFKGPLEEATQKNTLLPFVFLLGNHSSGKSSFINYVCQRKIQTAGVAPTDDTFTIICPGSADSDRDGPAVIGDPDMGFQGLRSFGPQLIHHTQLKVRSNTALNDFCIVDTPGMIDSPMRRDSDGINRPAAMDRGYDFEGVCRWYAERADVILLFFDPDKPGTTGETLSILTNSLVGQDYKLHIILNKADQFRKIHDFARAYGSLCWNLSKVIQRKDLPRIYTMCLPAASRPLVDSQEGEGRSLGQGIADLEEAREEVVAEVLNAPKRRVDNEVSRLSDSVCVLQMHCKIIEDISSKYQAALLRTRASLAAASFTSVLLPSATIIFTHIVPDSGVAITVSNTVLFGNPLISILAATTGVGAVATGGLYWWKYTSLGSLAHKLVSDDSLYASYRKIYVRRIAEKDEFTASLWKRVLLHIQMSLSAADLQAMETITPKELKVLENVLDVEEFHWVNFRFAELDALLLLNGIEPSTAYTYDEISHGKDDAFLPITLPGMSVAASMCERSILIKAIYELWCYGSSLVGAIDEAKQLSKTFLGPYLSEDKSWSVNVDSHCKSYSMSEKEKCRNHFRFLDFKGKVNLDDADVQLWVLLDYSQANRSIEDGTEEIGTSAVPCYLGRLLSRGGMKDELKKYDLKKRLYLGPTSLDPSLALIMANMGGVKKGHLAFDPFAGTASILVALAHFGAKCFGSDIDPRVLRGQMYAGSADQSSDPTKRDIFENFSAYSLEKPELIRMDNHLLDRHLQIIGSSGVVSIVADGSRGCGSSALPCSSSSLTASSGSSLQKNVLDGMFDVIVTDPPYGIRAGAKKSGKRKQVDYTVSADRRLDHIPSTQHYAVEEVMLDLLHTAARMLVCGGRLVYLIPTVLDFSSKDLPTHPCLSFVRLCEQQLSTRHGRHAVLMVKHRDYSDALEEEFSAYKKVVLSGQDSGFGSLMTRLEAALSVNAYDNESVLKKCSNSSVKRKESKIRRAKRREEEGPGAAFLINRDALSTKCSEK